MEDRMQAVCGWQYETRSDRNYHPVNMEWPDEPGEELLGPRVLEPDVLDAEQYHVSGLEVDFAAVLVRMVFLLCLSMPEMHLDLVNGVSSFGMHIP
jgi:hypothetical protein